VTTSGLDAVPAPLATQAAAMSNLLRRLTASAAVVVASLYLARRGAGPHGSGAAVGEIFVGVAVLLLLTAFLARRLPGAARRSLRTEAQAAAA
jgi:hypothetical protein